MLGTPRVSVFERATVRFAFPRLLQACVLLFCVTFPASPQVAVDLWTADNGVPQNIIRAICQTPDGYLWLATFDGLVRFDGVRFTQYTRNNTPVITSNRVRSRFCTTRGRLL